MSMESIGSYSLEATELRLSPPGTSFSITKTKRPLDDDSNESSSPRCCTDVETTAPVRPAKSQVVGWPPVQAFRRNARQNSQQRSINAIKASSATTKEPPMAKTSPTMQTAQASPAALMVKVSMDGAPYLRKIDLGAYSGYTDLRLALDAMFHSSCFPAPHQQLIYEDNDSDWMLVGDVPWVMFADSCKRLRIVKTFSGTVRPGSVGPL